MRKLALIGLLGLSQCVTDPCMPDPNPIRNLDLRVAAMSTLLETKPDCANYHHQYDDLTARYHKTCETLTAPEQACTDFNTAIRNFRTTVEEICPEELLYQSSVGKQ